MTGRVTISLNELHCEAQSEQGGCEPYLFTSFYAVGSNGEVSVTSPKHADVREAFDNDIEAGTTLPVPQEIGQCELPGDGKMGVVALVIDEDAGRIIAVDKAHDAFHQGIDSQLREKGEVDCASLLSAIKGAIHGTFDYNDLHRDQDDILGVAVHAISGHGPFEVHLGTSDEDRFILRGEAR
ncbi:hypothetical protein GCM10022280_20510 [Sphingomonas swuensis]|uniref:Uncharacterized protein n=1 Tax=Sphingomonas swuensis TaxID=977800 RepID=A0ABP7T2J9_9SPHN